MPISKVGFPAFYPYCAIGYRNAFSGERGQTFRGKNGKIKTRLEKFSFLLALSSPEPPCRFESFLCPRRHWFCFIVFHGGEGVDVGVLGYPINPLSSPTFHHNSVAYPYPFTEITIIPYPIFTLFRATITGRAVCVRPAYSVSSPCIKSSARISRLISQPSPAAKWVELVFVAGLGWRMSTIDESV